VLFRSLLPIEQPAFISKQPELIEAQPRIGPHPDDFEPAEPGEGTPS